MPLKNRLEAKIEAHFLEDNMAKYVMHKYVQSDMEVITPGQRVPITFEVWDVHVSRDGSKKYGIRCSDLFEDVTVSVSERELFKLMEVEGDKE